MASLANTTRRSLFAIAGAATLLPSIAVAGGEEVGRFQSWERQIAALDAASEAALNDDEVDVLQDWRRGVEALIADTPATKRGSFAVKARLMADARRMDLDSFGEDLARQIAQFLEAN